MRKIRKSFLSLVMVLMMGFSVVGCGEEATVEYNKNTEVTEATTAEVTTEEETTEEETTEEVTTEAETEEVTEAEPEEAEDNSDIVFGEGKTVKDGFDSSSNKSAEAFGFTFELPDYMGDKADISTDSLHYYYAEQTGKVAMLMLQGFDCAGIKEDDIKDYAETYMSGFSNSLTGYKKVDSEYTTVAGHQCYREKLQCTMYSMNCDCELYLLVDEGQGQGLTIFWCESDGTEYTYFNDFEKIVDSFKNK